MSSILSEIAHRPYPLPGGPWIMRQTWYNLLFAHWTLPVAVLRERVPAELEIDTFEGKAWIGVVPFGMSGIALRGLPALPWISRFLELNVRTYVVHRGRPGVYFFSLDAANPVAAAIGRAWYKLPYFHARMRATEKNGWIEYESRRGEACFEGHYRPAGGVRFSSPGSLEAFLTERYCLYTVDRGVVYRGEIHHGPWPLEPAEAEIRTNSMAAANSIELPGSRPLVHFVRSIQTVEWGLTAVRGVGERG